MSGVRIYSIYLNNMVKDIDSYIVTKNLNSSNIKINDLLDVATDLNEMVYLSDKLVESGESSLISSFDFLKRKLPIDSKGIILSDIGLDIVSTEVLKYCGSLLEKDKVDTKALGKIFKDISDGLTSVNSLSEHLLGSVYNTESEDDDEEDSYDLEEDMLDDVETYELDDGMFSDYSSKTDSVFELEYNDCIEEGNLLEDKGNLTEVKKSSMLGEAAYYNSDFSLEGVDANDIKDTVSDNSDKGLLNDDFNIEYDSEGNINDKLAYAITKVSKKITKTPSKVKEGSKLVYTNMVDFDN